MLYQGVGWGVGCFLKVLDAVSGCWMGCSMLYWVLDAFSGCWIECWMLFKVLDAFFVLSNTFGVGWCWMDKYPNKSGTT